MYEIITDTSANLESSLLALHHIRAIPFTFSDGRKEYHCTDTASFDGTAYYQAMRDGRKIQTSQITPQQYIYSMRSILTAGHDVLYIGMSSGISGSFSSAEAAAKTLRQEFPKREIALVDTLGASLGEGLLVLKAAEYLKNHVSLSETVRLLNECKMQMCQIFVVDDLKYLRSTGRLSAIKVAIASVLHLKPILKGDTEGKIVCFGRARGMKNAIIELAAQYDALVEHPEGQTVGIAHADCPENAALLAELLRKNRPPKEILTVCYEPVTGSHVGPGTLALFFMGSNHFRSGEKS